MFDSKITQLIDCYIKQYEKYKEFGAISEEIRLKLEQDCDTSVLANHLAEQSEVVRALNCLEANAVLLKEEICELLDIDEVNVTNLARVTGTEAKQFKAILQNISSYLSQLEEVEKKNQDLLKKRLEQVQFESSQLNSGKTANRAYRNDSTPVQSRFIDKKR